MVLRREVTPPQIAHKIKINPKYSNEVVFSETVDKDDVSYIPGWSFVNRET